MKKVCEEMDDLRQLLAWLAGQEDEETLPAVRRAVIRQAECDAMVVKEHLAGMYIM